MKFPMPLAMTDLDGRPQLVNAQFESQFDGGTIDPASLEPRESPQVVSLHGRQPGTPALRKRVASIRTNQCLLLVFVDDLPHTGNAHVALLENRINMLEKVAATDHLTGAWNRAHFDRVIDTEIARSHSSQLPLSLILLDIDHFKRVNDTHGHATGDVVLRELAERLRLRLRTSDLLFRWGGEEFAVLVSSTGYRSATIVAEALRLAVSELPFPTVGRVTVSIGVAEHVSNESAEQWFDRLDAALYTAKSGGRNRVVTDRRGDSDVWASLTQPAAPRLVWQEGYGCGNPTIDEGHKELFRLASEVIDVAVMPEGDPDRLSQKVDELLAHVAQHFRDEEAILERLDYAQLTNHRRAHAGLLRRAATLKARVEAGRAGLGAIVEFLSQDVVAKHMLTVDRAFFPLFADNAG